MASKTDEPKKWEGKITAKLVKPSAEEVWPLLEDFYNLHKWMPSIDTCYKVDGTDDALVRYCATTLPPPPGGGERVVKWCHEKLVAIDRVGKWLSYEALDNNIGLKLYKSTIKVVPIKGGDSSGCLIEWSFVADPVEGWSCDDLVKYIDMNLQGMSKNMEKALESS